MWHWTVIVGRRFVPFWIIVIVISSCHTTTEGDSESNTTVTRVTMTTSTVSENVTITTAYDYRDDIIVPIPCSEFTMELYRKWNFAYTYSQEVIAKLLCKCKHICRNVSTVKADVQQAVREEEYGPLSPDNRTRFIIVITLFGVMFLVGVIGNITTIVGIVSWMKQKSPTYAFVISLCCSDLMMLCICMPIKVTEYFYLEGIFTNATCRLSYYARDLVLISTVLTHTTISFERYYAICRPMEVKYKCTWSRARKMIAITWLISVCLAIPSAFLMQLFMNNKTLSYECSPQSTSLYVVVLYFLFTMGVMFIIPAGLMSIMYGRSCHVLWKSTLITEKLQAQPGKTSIQSDCAKKTKKDSESVRSRRKVVRLLIVVVVLFIVCWGPLLILQVLDVTNRLGIYRYQRDIALLVAAGLTYWSSTLNPYLFMAMSSQFGNAAVCLSSCIGLRRTAKHSGSSTMHPTQSTRTTTSFVGHGTSQTHQTCDVSSDAYDVGLSSDVCVPTEDNHG